MAHRSPRSRTIAAAYSPPSTSTTRGTRDPSAFEPRHHRHGYGPRRALTANPGPGRPKGVRGRYVAFHGKENPAGPP
jgi:hypothetical protein